MANTFATYTGNGSTTNFTVPFSYINRSHVTVYMNGVESLSPLHWSWVSDSTITFVIAPPVDSIIEIARNTPKDVRLVDFNDGAVLTEAELDLAHTQHFYVAQEIIDNYDELLQSAKVRLATDAGVSITDSQNIIDAMVQEVLASDLTATLNSSITDIDVNGQNVLDIDVRMISLEATVDALADIDGTGIVTFIENEQTERIAGDNALAATLALVGAKNGAETAFILDTSTVKLDSDLGDTVATRLSALAATDSANTALITSEETARISADGALASDISTLTTSVNGNTASVQTAATSIDGLEAQYTVKVDINGYVSGYGLATTLSGATPTSEFVVLADKFAVVTPGAAAKAPFIVDSGNVYIDGNLLVSGSILAGALATNSVTADNINVTNLQAVSAAMGTVTGGTFRTAASGYRTEVSSVGAYPLWYGTGTKNAANAKFYVDTSGNAYFGGTLEAGTVVTDNISGGAVSDVGFSDDTTERTVTGGSYVTVNELTMAIGEVGDHANVGVLITNSFMVQADTGGSKAMDVRVYRTRISGSGTASGTVWEETGTHLENKQPVFSLPVKDTVQSGYTYKWSIQVSIAGGDVRKCYRATQWALVMKK